MEAARDRRAGGRLLWTCLVVGGLLASSTVPAFPQPCTGGPFCQFLSCRSPARAAPSQLWGEIRPADLGLIPNHRDSTNFHDILHLPSLQYPHWMALDVENGWVFTAIDLGIEIWDARTNPGNPTRTAQISEPSFPTWTPEAHQGEVIRDIDAPAGSDRVVAVGLVGNAGFVVFDTTSKSSPVARYADVERTTNAVYAASIGGRDYAFGANTWAGLLAYDLTAARALPSVCTDDTPLQNRCGVYESRLGDGVHFRYVDGVGNATGDRHWVVASSGSEDEGLEVWEVSNPAAPVLRIAALPYEYVHGVALWRAGSKLYLAMRSSPTITGVFPTTARIYDVTCLASGACAGLGAPLWSRPMPYRGDDYFVVESESHGRPFLYFGNFDKCSLGVELQNEWLFDVSCPRAPRDVMPPPVMLDGLPTSYWGWYYRAGPTGFNYVAPRTGKFHGSYFYRAANTVFDIHQIAGAAADPDLLFADGFECGTLPWSETVP